MSDEMCAARLANKDMFTDCKGCLGHNERVAKKTRKRKIKLPETETILNIVPAKKTPKARAKKVPEAPETPVADARKSKSVKAKAVAKKPAKKTTAKKTTKKKVKAVKK